MQLPGIQCDFKSFARVFKCVKAQRFLRGSVQKIQFSLLRMIKLLFDHLTHSTDTLLDASWCLIVDVLMLWKVASSNTSVAGKSPACRRPGRIWEKWYCSWKGYFVLRSCKGLHWWEAEKRLLKCWTYIYIYIHYILHPSCRKISFNIGQSLPGDECWAEGSVSVFSLATKTRSRYSQTSLSRVDMLKAWLHKTAMAWMACLVDCEKSWQFEHFPWQWNLGTAAFLLPFFSPIQPDSRSSLSAVKCHSFRPCRALIRSLEAVKVWLCLIVSGHFCHTFKEQNRAKGEVVQYYVNISKWLLLNFT